MASVNVRYTSLFQVKVVKLIYLLNAFLNFAIFSRLLLLINLIGLFQHISNGIHDFYSKSVIFITASEVILSLLKLIPITVSKIVWKRCLDLYIIYLFDQHYEDLAKNQIYSIYLMTYSLYELIEYINYYYGLFKIRKFKTLQYGNALILGNVKSVLEFLIIFKSLGVIDKGHWSHWVDIVVLLAFIPVKYIVLKKTLLGKNFGKVKDK